MDQLLVLKMVIPPLMMGILILKSGFTVPKTNISNMAGWKMPPFEDVLPIANADFPIKLLVFRGVISIPSKKGR